MGDNKKIGSGMKRFLYFSQRNGIEEVPQILKQKEIPDGFRRDLYQYIYSDTTYYDSYHIQGSWQMAVAHNFLHHDSLIQKITEGSIVKKEVNEFIEEYVRKSEYNKIFDLIEHFMGQRLVYNKRSLEHMFDEYLLAYQLHDGLVVPRATEAEGIALAKSLDNLKEAGFAPARECLRDAIMKLNQRAYADSVKKSIDAVESMVRKITEKNSVGAALSNLESQGVHIHKALQEGFKKLYGYTSDEQGVRHALVDEDKANVTEDEALYMLGTCSSFVSYLASKYRKTGGQ